MTIPEGEHELPAGLVIKNAKKLALRGVSKEHCVLKLARRPGAAKTEALLAVSGSAETVEIANLTLEGGSGEGTEIAAVILTDGTSAPGETPFKDIAVRDCIFQNFAGNAVLMRDTEGGSVERCSFRDGGIQAVGFHQGSQNCTARGNQIIRTQEAFGLLNASGCILTGNESRECGIAATVSNEEAALTHKAHILRNNHFAGAFLKVRPGTVPPLLEDNEGLISSPARQTPAPASPTAQ